MFHSFVKKLLYPFLILFFVLVFFWRNILLGEVFYFGDNFSLYIPNFVYWASRIKEGFLPLWNPYLFSGVPYLAGIDLGTFYPLNILYLMFPVEKALTFLIVFSVFLAGLFTFWFLKSLKFSREASFFGALIFAFSGTIMTWINNVSLLNSAIWLPLILMFVEKGLEQKSYRKFLYAGFFGGLQIVAGHVQPTYYTFFLVVAYILFRKGVQFRRRVSSLFVYILFSVLVSAVQVLPFLELAFNSTRSTPQISALSLQGLNPLLLLRFVFPYFFGTGSSGVAWGPVFTSRLITDNSGYIGVFGIGIVLLYLFVGWKKEFTVKFFLVIFIVSVLLSLGTFTPLFKIFFYFFPGFSYLRAPTQIIYLAHFAAAVIIADFFNRFRTKNAFGRIFEKATEVLVVVSLILIFTAGFVTLISFINFDAIWSLVNRAYFIVKKTDLSVGSFHSYEKDLVIARFLLPRLTISFLLIFLFSMILRLRVVLGKRVLFLVIAGLMLFDFNFNAKGNYFSAPNLMYEKESEVSQFLKGQPSETRHLASAEHVAYTGLGVYWENMVFGKPFSESVFDEQERKNFNLLSHRVSVLAPDWGMVYGAGSMEGYGAFVLKDYADFLKVKKEVLNINFVDSVDLSDKRIDELGVRFLVVDDSFESNRAIVDKVLGKYKLVKKGDGYSIWENLNAMPRAYFLGDNGTVAKANISEYKPERIVVEVGRESSVSGRLILTDSFYPGWKAWVGEREERIVPYKRILRSVKVEGVDKKVTFVFEPLSFKIGLIISVFTLLCFGGYLLLINFHGLKSVVFAPFCALRTLLIPLHPRFEKRGFRFRGVRFSKQSQKRQKVSLL